MIDQPTTKAARRRRNFPPARVRATGSRGLSDAGHRPPANLEDHHGNLWAGSKRIPSRKRRTEPSWRVEYGRWCRERSRRWNAPAPDPVALHLTQSKATADE